MPKVRKWLKKRRYQPTFALEKITASAQPTRVEAQLDTIDVLSQLVPYDENLLEQSRTQWQLGDWASLANLDRDALQRHPDRAKLALLAAAGQIQSNNPHAAQQLIRMAQDWGCSKRMVSQVLVAGVYSSLGKATLIAGDQHRAVAHYKTAASLANQKANACMLAEVQIFRETRALEAVQQQARQIEQQKAPVLPSPTKPDVGITSYAQNFEDVMLWRALGRVENGFYIDVGAHDPVVDSVSKAFYEHGWRGVHVEPLPEYAEALRNARPDERVVQAVLAEHPGTQTFYHIPKTGLSTGTEEFAHRHEVAGWQVNEITVPATTLAALFDEIGPRDIHWLKIDVEGMEADVLAGWGTHPTRPWIVVIEATEPCSQVPNWHQFEPLVLGMGYEFIYFDGLNRFYISDQHRELRSVLVTPPNVFDAFWKFQMPV